MQRDGRPGLSPTLRVHPLAPSSCSDMDQFRGGSCPKGANGAIARMVCPLLVAEVRTVPIPSGTGRTPPTPGPEPPVTLQHLTDRPRAQGPAHPGIDPGHLSTPSPLPVCFLQSLAGHTQEACPCGTVGQVWGASVSESLDSGLSQRETGTSSSSKL